MNIKVFLRQCYHSPNSLLPNRFRPKWFDKKKVFDNFKKNIVSLGYEYHIIYDSYYGDVKNTFLADEQIYQIKSGTEAGSFIETLNLIRNLDYQDDPIIYLVEDDYIHRQGWDIVLKEAFTLPVHYVSLYDHLDKYLYYPELYSQIFVTKSCHWRTVPSTCNTYAVKFDQLMSDFDSNMFYSTHSSGGISRDHDKFIDLGSKNRRLITPIPGYSTHCDHLMSPTINWEDLL